MLMKKAWTTTAATAATVVFRSTRRQTILLNTATRRWASSSLNPKHASSSTASSPLNAEEDVNEETVEQQQQQERTGRSRRKTPFKYDLHKKEPMRDGRRAASWQQALRFDARETDHERPPSAHKGSSSNSSSSSNSARTIDVYDEMPLSVLAKAMKMTLDSMHAFLVETGLQATKESGDAPISEEWAALLVEEKGFKPQIVPNPALASSSSSSSTAAAATAGGRDAQPRPKGDTSQWPLRPPIVTIMGHVDHGKTTLLDTLRKTSVAKQEAGGITQHIGAFTVPIHSFTATMETAAAAAAAPAQQSGISEITFLDTPGHAAFTQMRMRGAQATDIVVLCVAADDGVMPQTIEAIHHAKASGVQVLVALTKTDKHASQLHIEQIKNDLLTHDLIIEELGGDIQCVEVSAVSGKGLKALLESLLSLAEVMELKGDPTGPAECIVLESKLDKGRGMLATVLVQRGTLKPGATLVAGTHICRTRQIVHADGRTVKSAGPSTPVEISGWKTLPDAGVSVLEVASENEAKAVTAYRASLLEQAHNVSEAKVVRAHRLLAREKYLWHRERAKQEKYRAYIRLLQKRGVFISIDRAKWGEEDPKGAEEEDQLKKAEEGESPGAGKVLHLIVKADVSGSLEALMSAIRALQDADKRIKVLRASVGAVTDSDAEHAAVGIRYSERPATIIAFNVPHQAAARTIERNKVRVVSGKVIYKLLDEVKSMASELLDPIIRTKVLGKAEVMQVFRLSNGHHIAGCRVIDGSVTKDRLVQVRRGTNDIVQEGDVAALRILKDKVQEVKKGQECGIDLHPYTGICVGDIIESIQKEEEKQQIT